MCIVFLGSGLGSFCFVFSVVFAMLVELLEFCFELDVWGLRIDVGGFIFVVSGGPSTSMLSLFGLLVVGVVPFGILSRVELLYGCPSSP
jgi:hypothetical protein